MNGKIGLRIAVLVLILLVFLTASLAHAEQDTGIKTVRVGYVNHAGYEEGLEGEHKTGYGYEYLQRISYQAGWQYKYVYGSFSQLFEMLETGEIDLMGDISYTEARAERISYSAYPMSKEYYYMVCSPESQELRSSDISVLSGKKIGVTSASFQAKLLEDWLKSNRIDAEIIYYSGNKEVSENLLSGVTDAAVITKTSNTSEYSTVANIGYSEVYFGLAKDRPDLLRDINAALYSIQSTDPMYNDKVTSKYASYQNADLALSDSELAWLREHPVIRIGYLRDYLPLSAAGDSDRPEGLIRYLADHFSATLLQEHEVSFSFIPFDTGEELTQALGDGRIDAGFPFLSDFWYTEQNGFSETYEVATSTVSLIYAGGYDPASIRTIAVTGKGAMQTMFASVWYPGCSLVSCQDEEACLRAVLSGKADATLLLSSRAQNMLSSAEFQALHSVQCPRNASFCFELNKGSVELLTALNRSISALDGTEVLERMNAFLPYRTSYSMKDFVREHPAQVLTAASAVILLIAGTFAVYAIKSRRINRELNAARDEALRASAAKSTFLFNMSHDIRTPMNAIIGFTREAAQHTDDPVILKDSLDKVQSSSAYLLGIVNDVLDMSQIDSSSVIIKESTIDLLHVISDLMALLQDSAASRHQKLTEEHQIAHPCVVTDGLRLRQILMNVLDNAIKYTPNHGTIRFRITEVPSVQTGRADFTFIVEDNGIGMSKEFQPHAFEAFTREQNSTTSGIPGTGLGLSIVSGYTELLGGHIDLVSSPGQGTTMTIRFSFALTEEKQPDPEATETELKDRMRVLQGKRALIVEDNEINCLIADAVLKEFGMVTDTAVNGRIAVDKLRQAGEGEEAFDIVLMDIQMPVMDGYEAAREIRQMSTNVRNIPIIALSANAFDSDRQASKEAGMNAHLAKPLDVALLAETLIEYSGKNE